MDTQINCETYLYVDKKTPYSEAPHRGVITDGLSDEATYYVAQGTVRVLENQYNIFDKYGLMPENYDYFNFMLASGQLPICDYGENGEIFSVDERIMIENIENGKIVHYDSDGINGFDRIATYQDTPLGSIKTKELFDADGDGINEVEIEREIETQTKQEYRDIIADNPDYQWYDWWLNLIGKGRNKQVRYYWFEESQVLKSTTVHIGVNADDLGYDKSGGNHFEYEEKVKTYPNRDTEKKYQFYTRWRYADKDECKNTYK